jgi:hypothetical protein
MSARVLFLVLLTACSSPEEQKDGSRSDGAVADRRRSDASEPRFVDVAADLGLTRVHTGGSAEKGYIVEAKGGGVAWLDFDGDGDLDLYWVNGAILGDAQGGGNALYRNDGGSGFLDVAGVLGAEGRGWGMGIVSADYDNDGDADLYITNLRENILYRNDGDTGFAAVGGEAGEAVATWSTGAAFGDYDRDGDVDLYVAGYAEFDPGEIPRLGSQWKGVEVFVGPMGLVPEADRFFRNDEGRFVDITEEAGLVHPEPGYGFGVLFVDCDDDGDADLYVANDSSPNFLYRNDGDGTFKEVGLQAQVAYGEMGHLQAGMGVAWGDYDGDGRPDIFATHFEDDYNTLYRNEGEGLFADVAVGVGLGRASFHFVGFGTGFFDHDNDGDLDLLVANGHVYPQIERAGSGTRYAQPDQLFDNSGRGRFALLLPADGDSLGAARVSRGSAIADYDDDGDLDILVANLNDRPALLRNDVGNKQNWLGVKLVGEKSNRDGIGARLRLAAGGRVQIRDIISGSSFLSSEDPRAHFGLGWIKTVDSLEVRWPSGIVQVLKGLRANQYLVVEEADIH